VGLNHPSIAPYGAYAAKDGQLVLISIQNEREWQRLCAEVLEQPAMATDPLFKDNVTRVKNRPALDARIAAAFAARSIDDLSARLKAAQIAFGRVNSVAQFSQHPQLRRVTVDTPSGPVAVPAPPPIFVGETRAFGPVPKVGQHSDAIRREFAGAAAAE
jgi:crotonobetainyl-CoA:carnitine CoA-transferase CaiB-like acyl-CoA transferase